MAVSSESPSLIPTILRLMNGYQVTQAIHVMVRLGIADILRDGRLLVIDAIVPDGGGNSPAKWNDLHMFMMCDGKERTREEFAMLCNEAGFTLGDVRSAGGISIFEGIPACPRTRVGAVSTTRGWQSLRTRL